MHLIPIASKYLELQLLIVASGLLAAVIGTLTRRLGVWLRPSKGLVLCYLVLLANFIFPLFSSSLPAKMPLQPAIQIWAGQSYKETSLLSLGSSPFVALPSVFPGADSRVPIGPIEIGMCVFAALSLVLGATRLLRSYIALRRIKEGAYLVRKIGRVSIYVSDFVSVPMSYALPGSAVLLLPFHALNSLATLRIAVSHELQHHRQKDTAFVHLIEILKAVFFLNPFIHLLDCAISELQELACDEDLLIRRKVSALAYGKCLIQAAEQGIRSNRLLAGTVGMSVSVSAHKLKRRIDMMSQYQPGKAKLWVAIVTGVITLATIGAVGYAGQSVIKDQRISLTEAQALARTTTQSSRFPVVVNERVLTQLNRYVGTPDGRQFMREALTRMGQYQAMIDRRIKTANLPEEFLAVPIIESGYKNFKRKHAAGLWMFIESTAKQYGLSIDDKTDQRLDVEKETDAAMKLLSVDYQMFQDWQLALLAYNAGEKKVQEGIDQTHSRDPWTLIERGFEGDKNYLPMFMAALIIMKNPELVK